MDDTLDILKLYITIGRDRYIKTYKELLLKDDRSALVFNGMISECNNILAFISEIESNDFNVNSIANIDNKKI